jgi:hypothetical protein
MRAFVGFDDTDHVDADRGTGKLARWFGEELPMGCVLSGVVRQQLLVHENIPYTSHNSSACVVLEIEDPSVLGDLTSKAAEHVECWSLEGSDPGVCVAFEGDPALSRLIDFSYACTQRVVTQREAMEAARGAHLSGHGGTNQGIIGAAAAVGLTAEGWNGRFIELGRLRDLPDCVRVSQLCALGIQVVSLDRDARVPLADDVVLTRGWLRPRLLGNRATLPVMPKEPGIWESMGGKRNGKNATGVALSLTA